VSNWATTGDHLVKTLGTGFWPVAGLDLALLATAALACLSARRIGLRERVGVAAPAARATPSEPVEAVHG
jgi:hypothetical protein